MVATQAVPKVEVECASAPANMDDWDVVPTGRSGGASSNQSSNNVRDVTAEDVSGLGEQDAVSKEPKLTTPNQSESRSASTTAVDEQERPKHLKTTARRLRLDADLDACSAHKASSSEHSEPELLFDDAEEGAPGPEMHSEHAQEVWQRTSGYMADIQQAFKQKPAVRIQGAERHMKLLLVGEPGLGKPLFIKNMFAPYCHDTNLPVNCTDDDTSAKTFAANPDNYCTEIAVDVDENRTRIHYRAQDTPGVHLPGAPAAILDHVLSQSRKFMAAEEDPKRVVPMSALPDSRVDICIYFVPPHFLKPQDIELITKLSEFVPVVPIIAKADSLTTLELEQYRKHVRAELNKASAAAGRPVMHNFSAEDLAAAGASRDVPPFAVITSSDVDLAVGRYWPVRVFPWGKCEAMTSNHSDLPLLKRLLFEVGFEGLKAATENRFYTLRESCLTSRVLSRALSSGVLSPTVPTTADSAADDNAADVRTISPRQKPPSPLPSPSPSPSSPHGKAARWFGTWAVAGLVAAIVLLEMAAVGYYAARSTHLEAVVARQQSEAATEAQVLADLVKVLDLDIA